MPPCQSDANSCPGHAHTDRGSARRTGHSLRLCYTPTVIGRTIRWGFSMRILIVGGGIGGLAAALALRQAGFDARVYEQASVLREVGAGVQSSPNAVKVLHRVHRGELPFDRTVQVSVTDRLEKDQILGRLPHNLATLDRLLERNADDYRVATSKSARAADRKAAWKRLSRRRCRAGRRTGCPIPHRGRRRWQPRGRRRRRRRCWES